MPNLFILTAYDVFRTKYYTSKFSEYEDAERTARFLLQNPNVWAVKFHKSIGR